METGSPEQGQVVQPLAPESGRSPSMSELIERMAKAVVSDPDSVLVREFESSNITRFKLRVAPHDIGRVIGKRGRVANAMRIVLRQAAGLEGKRVTLDIESIESQGET